MPRQTRRTGMTIIELVVAIIIIFIIISLLLVAISAGRESARNIKCVANLKQIGIALNAYNTVHGMFPPNFLKTSGESSSNRMSGFAYILNELDQISTFNSINFSFVKTDSPTNPATQNMTARDTSISIFLCPSDTSYRHLNSYRFNGGRLSAVNGYTDGPFSIGKLPRDDSISDGLSNTGFACERISGTFSNQIFDPIHNIKSAQWIEGRYPGDTYFIEYCTQASIYTWNQQAGKWWIYNGMVDSEYNHNGSPNDLRSSCGGTNYGLYPPRSYHHKGVNLLYGDGHVTFIKNSISEKIWLTIGTDAGNDQ